MGAFLSTPELCSRSADLRLLALHQCQGRSMGTEVLKSCGEIRMHLAHFKTKVLQYERLSLRDICSSQFLFCQVLETPVAAAKVASSSSSTSLFTTIVWYSVNLV